MLICVSVYRNTDMICIFDCFTVSQVSNVLLIFTSRYQWLAVSFCLPCENQNMFYITDLEWD